MKKLSCFGIFLFKIFLCNFSCLPFLPLRKLENIRRINHFSPWGITFYETKRERENGLSINEEKREQTNETQFRGLCTFNNICKGIPRAFCKSWLQGIVAVGNLRDGWKFPNRKFRSFRGILSMRRVSQIGCCVYRKNKSLLRYREIFDTNWKEERMKERKNEKQKKIRSAFRSGTL